MNIANKLTILRMILIPVFMIFMGIGDGWGSVSIFNTAIPTAQVLAGLVFIFASFTDYLDGYLARKHDLITPFGVFFDPMADKLLVLAAFNALIEIQVVPSWVVTVIIARELLVTGLRVLLARADGEVLAASWPGKVKTVTQMLAIIFYLFNNFGIYIFGYPIGDYFLYICLFFTVASGIEYYYKGRFVFKESL